MGFTIRVSTDSDGLMAAGRVLFRAAAHPGQAAGSDQTVHPDHAVTQLASRPCHLQHTWEQQTQQGGVWQRGLAAERVQVVDSCSGLMQ